MSGNFPFEIKPFTKEENEALEKVFTANLHRNVRVGPKQYTLTDTFADLAADIYNMPLRSDDIFVVTFPRSGTTWTQELVWLVANDLDFAKAKEIPLTQRYPFLESTMFFSNEVEAHLKGINSNDPDKLKLLDEMLKPGTEILANTPSPRFIKTHLPLSLLPPKVLETAKTIYVARDPRDVAVSYYHFTNDNNLTGCVGSFAEYFELFEKGLITWCPFFEHLKEAWALRHHPNMLFLFYEELNKDLKATAKRVAEFLGKKYDEQQLNQLCEHLKIDNFKKNAAVDIEDGQKIGMFKPEFQFVRKGKSGGWRDYFVGELEARAQRWMDEELRGTDLRFPNV